MKSNRIILITLLSFLCIGINAQYFAGGSIGFYVQNVNSESGDIDLNESKRFSTSFSPTAGVFLSDKFAIGLALNTRFSKQETGVDIKNTIKTTDFGLSPFVKYYAVKWNKISLYGKGTIRTMFSKTSNESGDSVNNFRSTSISLSVYPGLSYDISDKLQLHTSLNFMDFSCGYSVSKNLDTDTKTSETNFGFSANTNSIAIIGDIMVGAIYRF